MTNITPKNLTVAISAATQAKVFTADAAQALTPGVLHDLANSDAPLQTLKLAAQNLRAFLAPFATAQTADAGGVHLDRAVRHTLTDIADQLAGAAERLETVKGGLFGVAMGLSVADGVVTVQEAEAIGAIGERILADAQDPGATARLMRGMLAELETMFAQTAAFGSNALGSGPSRDEVFAPQSSAAMNRLNVTLGQTIAAGIKPDASQVVAADGAFAKGVRDAMNGDPMMRALMFEAGLPSLVQEQLAIYDSTGLRGPAKLAMDRESGKIAQALVAHVNAAAPGVDHEDLRATVFRLVTGEFLPADLMKKFTQELAANDVAALTKAQQGMQERAATFDVDGASTTKNLRKAWLSAAQIVGDHLATR